jgi:serine/threonine-protein kinase
MAIGGRYEILGALGRGGMARVVRAKDVVLGREVALKLLDGKASAALATRFEREARAIARLDHPGCVRILDSAPRYLVMELLAGETLASRLLHGALPEADAVRIARGVLAALAHAHARGVLHRDIKPTNVMLVGARVVLIDFGLACIESDAAVTAAGMCVGSPSYVAPERLLGRGYDARADLYAVGVMLYEMLSGVRPFIGGTPEATMKLALSRPPRPLRGISAPIAAAAVRALAKDPRRRFADAEDMMSALELPAPAHEPDPSASSTIAMIVQRPWWSRAWSRVRYGRWRWA